jgi:hypothetical protein
MAFGDIVQQAADYTREEANQPAPSFASAPTQGNLLVAVVASRVGATITPSGWTEAIEGLDPFNVDNIEIFYKIAGASEPQTVVFDDSSLTEWHLAYIAEVEGSFSSPFDKGSSSFLSSPAQSLNTNSTDTLISQPQFCIAGVLVRDDAASGSTSESVTNGFSIVSQQWSLAGPGATGMIVAAKVATTTDPVTTTFSWNVSTAGEGCSALATFVGGEASSPADSATILKPGVRPGTRAGAIQ